LEKNVSKFGVSPPNDDKGGVGGLNCTPLVMVIFIIPGSCSLSMVNLNFNLGIPFKIQSQKDDTLVMVQTKSTRMLNLL
jgi:hypothetical protein